MTEKNPYFILCVDDEPDVLEAIQELVRACGYSVTGTTDPSRVESILEKEGHRILLILSDFKMDPVNGLDLRKQILEKYKDIPFVIVSAFVTKEMALKGIELKIAAFFDKPLSQVTLANVIEKEAADRRKVLDDEAELLRGFVDESQVHLEELESLVLTLETNPADLSIVNQIFGIVHTIKGVSGFFKPDDLHRFTHRFEDFINRIRKGELTPSSKTISVFLNSLDLIGKMVAALDAGNGERFDVDECSRIYSGDSEDSRGDATQGAVTSSGPQTVSKKKSEIRVSTDLLDEFMELSGEITVLRNMINKLVRSIEKEYGGNKDVTLLSELLDEMHKINITMTDKILDLRKIALKNVFRPLVRAGRDLSEKLTKEIKMEFEGDELRVDTAICEVLSASLIHMVRNSIDHGIEDTETRKRAGKPSAGSVRILAEETPEEIIVQVIDDGKGIDPEAIRSKVLEKCIRTRDQLDAMKESDLLALLFEPGFSTAATVTDVSGRGVGADMVKSSVEKRGGRIEVHSEVGKGSRFSIFLPVPKSVVIVSSLFVELSGRTFALPRDEIQRLLCVEPDKKADCLRILEGVRVLELDGELIELVDLSRILCLESKEPDDADLNIVVCHTKKGRFGLVVDRIRDVEDTVVKRLSSHFRDLVAFSGATFLGDGGVGLILSPDGVAEMAGIKGFVEQKKSSLLVSSEDRESHGWAEYLLFDLHCKGHFAASLDQVFRLEQIDTSEVQKSGGLSVVVYRDQLMPLISVSEKLKLGHQTTEGTLPVLVLKKGSLFLGMVVKGIDEFVKYFEEVDTNGVDREGLVGNLLLPQRTANVVDLNWIAENFVNETNRTLTAGLKSEPKTNDQVA